MMSLSVKEFPFVIAVLAMMTLNVVSTLDVKNLQLVGSVDPRFLSVALDSHQLKNHWKFVPLGNAVFIRLAKALSPAVLRVGGTDADVLFFRENGLPLLSQSDGNYSHVPTSHQSPADRNCSITGTDILKLGKFARQAQLDLVYNLNVLLRNKTRDTWDSDNSATLLRYFHANSIPLYGLQLGNEPDSFQHTFNTTVSSPQLAKDFHSLRNLLNRIPGYKKTKLIGPDVTRPVSNEGRSSKFLQGFLKNMMARTLDAISFHQYYFSGRTSSEADFLNVTVMDYLEPEIRRVREIVSQLKPSVNTIWIGETSTAWGGGCQNVSDRFIASFIWLDKLGQAALDGISVVVKQTLTGGYYGLIRPDMTPTPNYFVSLLHKRLVGQKVLKVHVDAGRNVRLYAHCTPGQPGSATIFGMNLAKTDHFIPFRNDTAILYDAYVIQAPALNSTVSFLNGKAMELAPGGKIPNLPPIRNKETGLNIPHTSLGFWVFPEIANSFCS